MQRRRRAFQQSSPRGDIYVHLIGTWEILDLLLEYLPLSLQFWLPRDHWIEKLDFGKQQALRLQLQRHAVPHVVNKLL